MTEKTANVALSGRERHVFEAMVSQSAEMTEPVAAFDLSLFKQLNEEYASRPVVPAPRPMSTVYTTDVGQRRAKMIDGKIGIAGKRVLELGCGDASLSRVLAAEHGCSVVGVDVNHYDSWDRPAEGDVTCLVHDVGLGDNASLGRFDRVVSFAVFEHIVHPNSALTAAFDLLKPGGKAFIYANLYRGAKASHRYREVFFPWPHLLFQTPVWQQFYRELTGEPSQAAWVNKLTYDQYLVMADRIGFRVLEHYPSKPYFDESFYRRFEYELAAYPRFDLMHDFIHLVLEKPGGEDQSPGVAAATRNLLDDRPRRAGEALDEYAASFWAKVADEMPDWLVYRDRWTISRAAQKSALDDRLPWIAFPAIDFLDRVLDDRSRVFEWGSGGSTLFFSERAAHVTSIEHDRNWYDRVDAGLAARANVDTRLVDPAEQPSTERLFQSGSPGWKERDFEAYVRAIERAPDDSLDVILVDGRARMGCLAAAAAKLAPGGWLMLDNANYARYATQLAAFEDTLLTGWERVDLAGPGPYSATPCWQTLAWRKPEVPSRPLTADDVTATREALRVAAPVPFRSIWSDRGNWITSELNDIANGAAYELWGARFRLGALEEGGSSRTNALWLASWAQLEPFFQMIDRGMTVGDGVQIGAARFVLDQIFEHQDGRAAASLHDALGEDFLAADVAISSRFYCLAFLLAATASDPDVSQEEYGRLLAMFRADMALLKSDEAFSPQSNHGLIQAAQQLAGAGHWRHAPAGIRALFDMDALEQQARSRLADMIARQFGSDDVHLEHSPGYHLILGDLLLSLVESGLVDDPEISRRIHAIAANGAWMRDPDGQVVAIGDSMDGSWLEPSGQGTRDGQPASCSFRQAGYWFVSGGGTYLAQAAGFHSRAHKQADTGAFVWHDRGQPILVDAGRYGYAGRTEPQSDLFRDGFWYSDPRRIYVESTKAHNTLSLDGGNHPRFRSKPYGSGIVATADDGRIFACESSIRNLPRATHARLLILSPGEWLICVDDVRMRDGAEHRLRQNFHLHPDWAIAEATAQTATWTRHDGNALHMQPLFDGSSIVEVGRGVGDPDRDPPTGLFGWWSLAPMVFEPCESIGVGATGSHVTMATLFGFAPVLVDSSVTGFNATRRRLRFKWKANGKTRALTIDRDPKDGVLRLS